MIRRRGSGQAALIKSSCAFVALAVATGLAGVGLVTPSAAADPGVTPETVPPVVAAPTPASPTAKTGATRTVSYGGVSAQVPASWRVVELDKAPGTCVRLDVATVYLGAASEQQNCPARAIGRADTLWLAPSPSPVRSAPGKVGVMAAKVVVNDTSHEQVAEVAGRQVVVQATWGSARTSIDPVLSTVKPTTGVVPQRDLSAARTSPSTERSATAVGPSDNTVAPKGAPAQKLTPSAARAGSGNGVFTGLGMDTCAAPSLSTMKKWKASRYRAAGIYLGGLNRSCGDGNLSSSWVSSVSAEGWGLMPLYVGLQAPCANQRGLASISATNPAGQGVSAATDAVAKARKFGISTGNTIYYNMEPYGASASCRSTVLAFLSAWTSTLRRSGYLSGVYGTPASTLADVANAGGGFVAPDRVWLAFWNGIATTRAQSIYPRVPDSKWSDHQRIHQYAGNTAETWGGVRLELDSNWIDTRLAGNAKPVDYGNHTTGPVGAGFGWTGSMSSWRYTSGQGLRGHAAWSGSSGSASEYNGASWSMYLTPGTYSAMAYLPPNNSGGKARYSIRGSGVSVNSVLNQAGAKGYRSVGTFTLKTAGTIVVHVGDNGGSAAGTPFSADAMWFKPLSAPTPAVPGAVSGVHADVADGSSTVRWAPPSSGAAATGYTITASPGGQVVTATAGSQKVTVPGLRNGTAYKFTVAARNAVGTGPGANTATVVPTAPTRLTAVAPVRLVDTRRGTSFNRVGTSLGAGQSLTFKVSGLPGSPVPSWATGAQLHVTVVASTGGWLTTPAGAVSYGPAQVTASSRLFPLSGKSVTVTNRGSAPVHLLIDAEAYASLAGARWTPTSHVRLLDTRVGTSSNSRRTAIPAGQTVAVRVAGAPGSPVPAGSDSAVFNVTAVSSAASGYLTIDSDRTSIASFAANRTIASTTLSRIRPDGTITVTNHSSRSLNVLVDVQGYGSPGGDQWTVVPSTRVVSASGGTATYPNAGRVAPRATLTVQVRDTRGTPLPGTATGAAVSVEVSSARAGGYLTGRSSAGAPSLLNFTAGGTGANTALLPISSAGTVSITNMSSEPVSLVIDVTAYTGR